MALMSLSWLSCPCFYATVGYAIRYQTYRVPVGEAGGRVGRCCNRYFGSLPGLRAFICKNASVSPEHFDRLVTALPDEWKILKTCYDITWRMDKNVREGQISNYINSIESVGEWVRLDHQARLVGKATEVLPALLDEMEFTRILDVGCGPGQWALDIAADRPEAEVTGIDLSTEMMNYANARARSQNLNNVSFQVQDFLAKTLPFPKGRSISSTSVLP